MLYSVPSFPVVFPDGRAEADGKFLHPDAAAPGGAEMPPLVYQHDDAEHKDGGHNGEQSCHIHLAKSKRAAGVCGPRGQGHR